MNSDLKPLRRLFVFTGSEIVVIFLIMFMVSAFAFTLGVHLEKRVGYHPLSEVKMHLSTVTQLPDRIPDREDLTEKAKTAAKVVDETLIQELHDEVIRSGVHLKDAHEVELPAKPKSSRGGATTLSNH